MTDLKSLKSEAIKFPEPLRTLILTAKDSMGNDEILNEFLKWRKTARAMEIHKDVK